jgi:hypothetical protein
VPPKIEFETLNNRHSIFDEVGLSENAEHQREHWKMGVNGLQAVIAALIDVNDVIAE